MEAVPGIPGGVSSAIPSGAIMMWYGSAIPTGWAVCDGQNGTPDLRDRFIVGAGHDYNLNATGGSKEVTLTTAQMPSHSHSGTISSHSHSISSGSVSANAVLTNTAAGNPDYIGMCPLYGGSSFKTKFSLSGSTSSASPGISVNANGGNEAHDNMPPYYALYFIMKL